MVYAAGDREGICGSCGRTNARPDLGGGTGRGASLPSDRGKSRARVHPGASACRQAGRHPFDGAVTHDRVTRARTLVPDRDVRPSLKTEVEPT